MRSLIGLTLLGLAAGAVSFAASPDDEVAAQSEQFVRIDLDRRADDPIFVATRCRDFVLAVMVARQIEVSNPVTGRNAERGTPLNWVMSVDWDGSFPEALPPKEVDYSQKYLDHFDLATKEQAYVEGPLYLNDKKTCEPFFRQRGE